MVRADLNRIEYNSIDVKLRSTMSNMHIASRTCPKTFTMPHLGIFDQSIATVKLPRVGGEENDANLCNGRHPDFFSRASAANQDELGLLEPTA
jgi:hypothetical protein